MPRSTTDAFRDRTLPRTSTAIGHDTMQLYGEAGRRLSSLRYARVWRSILDPQISHTMDVRVGVFEGEDGGRADVRLFGLVGLENLD
jgi:hypothetical protein